MKSLILFLAFALIGIALFLPFNKAAAQQCQTTTQSYQQSWYGCFGQTDKSDCQAGGGYCSGGWCYAPQTTTNTWTCSDTTAGSCSYSSTCDESGDVTTTYYSCGSSVGSCTSSSSTESGACSRNTNGTSCGTNQVCSGGSCIQSCVSNQGQSCNINACGQAGGTIQCDGSCSGSTPATPYTIGAACNRNSCGGTGTITNACTGTCSASPPIIYTLGESCTSSPNACGATNGTITDSCSGTCTPPSNPSTCTACNNVGECNTGYQCSTGCTATKPADKTISVSVTATPSSGPAPLKNVKVDASVGGTATGTITYKLDCTNDGAFDDSATSDSTSFTFTKKCDYLAAGSYTAMVEVTRQTLKATDTETIVAASVSLAADPSASTVAAKTTVTYTATSGFDVGPTPYYIRIYEGTTQLQSCSTGTTCSYATSDTNRTRTFIGEIQDSSDNTIAASNSITTTWQAAAVCAAPQNLSCTYNSSSKALTLSWGAVANVKDYFFEWAKWGSGYTFCFFPGCTADSKTVSTTSGTTSSLSTNTTYKLHVRAETAQGNTCAAPGPFSQEIECYTGTCNKTSTPRTDTFTVPVQTDTGTKNCTINVTHSGRDYYDSQLGRYDTNISYQETACQRNLITSSSNIQDISCQANSTTNSSTIAVDDDPVSGCNNNLVFTNSFGISTTGTLNAIGEVNSKDAGHDLAFGYEFSTSQCVITGVQGSGYTTEMPDGSYVANGAFSPIISSDGKSASYQQAIYNNTGSTSQTSNFTFTLKECTQDSHCSAPKGYCNISGGTRNLSTFPQNTCIDSVPPTSTFSSESQFKNTSDGNKAPGYNNIQQRWWLKQGTWSISITDTDIGGAEVDTTKCTYLVDDLGRTTDNPSNDATRDPTERSRTCNGSLTLSIGPSGDCQTQGDSRCSIKIKTIDRAGNPSSVLSKTLNIDYTPPTAQ